MPLRHWIRTNTLKSQYQLWIGKNVKASQKVPQKGNKVIFTKEKDAYTWSSSKRYAVSCIDNNNKRNKGSYLVKVYTTKDDVIFDVFGLSKLKINDEEKDQLIEAGMSIKKANLIKDILDEISQEAFKEIVNNWIFECANDIDNPLSTPEEVAKYSFERFVREYDNEYNRKRHPSNQNRVANWLMGCALHFPIYYSEMIALAKEWGTLPQDATEKQEDKICSNYWNFTAAHLIMFWNKYGYVIK